MKYRLNEIKTETGRGREVRGSYSLGNSRLIAEELFLNVMKIVVLRSV